jgi:chromate transporter
MLKLGCLAFGGPSAHIAMLEDEVVERRQWMTRQHFLDLVGATSLIPGPNSTEMMMHIGFERGRWLGLSVAGVLFVLPAAVITGIFAALYASYGSLPQLAPLLWGVKPAVLVVILGAVWRLGRSALKTWRETLLGIAVVLAVVMGVNELVALFAGAVLGTFWLLAARAYPGGNTFVLLPLSVLGGAPRQAIVGGVETETASVTLAALGLFFFKVGAVLYGRGYVLVAFLESDLVERLGWLTSEQLLDAIAVGQMTPGPVLSTATFIGYLLLGAPGAMVATVAIFLPSFFFVALLNPIIPKLRQRPWTAAFLDAVNSAALALMAAVVVKLGVATLDSWQGWVVALLAAVALFRLRLHSAWLILGGALLGYLFQLASVLPGVR